MMRLFYFSLIYTVFEKIIGMKGPNKKINPSRKHQKKTVSLLKKAIKLRTNVTQIMVMKAEEIMTNFLVLSLKGAFSEDLPVALF